MTIVKANGVSQLVKSQPVIGSKFSGPNFYLDTQSHVYWSVMNELTADEIRIQSALLSTKVTKQNVNPKIPSCS